MTRAMKGGLRRALGGNKNSTAASLFAQHSSKPRSAPLSTSLARGALSSLTAVAVPRTSGAGRRGPIWANRSTPQVVNFYEELVKFVLGSATEAELWRLWHAWMLQNPGKAPGWGWIVNSGQGLGKDLLNLPPRQRPTALDYTPVGFRAFFSTATMLTPRSIWWSRARCGPRRATEAKMSTPCSRN